MEKFFCCLQTVGDESINTDMSITLNSFSVWTSGPGASPTNDILIKFQIQPKISYSWLNNN